MITVLAVRRRHQPEATLSRSVSLQRALDLALVEVGPERRRAVKLRVRRLPDEEVRQTQLARRADDKVWVRDVLRVEVGAKRRLVDARWVDAVRDHALHGVDDFGA